MKNAKVILLSGFARGGTNIVWNILQSHPDIVSPAYETGELFRKSIILRLLNTRRRCERFPFGSRIIDHILFRHKMNNLRHVDNRYRNEGVLYSREQMEESALCIKSVNNDILITDLLSGIYPDLYFIGLARNGYSLADGYMRRGQTAGEAGRLYRRIADEMQRCSNLVPRFKLVKFEEVLNRPFEVARDLFAFVDARPRELDTLRLKSKRVINNAGDHKVSFGDEHRKYWFPKDSIRQILDPDIDQKQKARLSDQAIEEFNREAASALRYFGYETVLSNRHRAGNNQ